MNIPQRLSLFESDFISALSGDANILDTFQHTWLTLVNDIDKAIKLQNLDDRSITNAHGLASRIQIISDHFLNLRSESEVITTKLMNELDDIFSGVSAKDTSPSNFLPSPSHSDDGLVQSPSTPTSGDRRPSADSWTHDPCPAYVAPAYKWLLKNMHDPYPSNDIKLAMSHSTGTPLKHINAWFMNVRRRMGWTTISRKHFSNRRSETVDAAYRALVNDDPGRPLESNIILDFMALKAATESLYSEKFRESVLARKLDAVVKDAADKSIVMRDVTKGKASHDELQEMDANHQDFSNEIAVRNSKLAQSSYPSPDRSTQSSPEPILPAPSPERIRDLIPSDPTASRKRRIPSDSEDDSLNPSGTRPAKRSCPSPSTPKTSLCPPMTLPPSPHSPKVESSNELDYYSSISARSNPSFEATFVDNSPPRNRKRRLSEADSYPTPKRPRGLTTKRHPQAVSDPLPSSDITLKSPELDPWFQVNFDMADAVTAEELDPSTIFDVKHFKDWISLGDHTMEFPVQTDKLQHVGLLSSELQSITPDAFNLTSFPELAHDSLLDVESRHLISDALGSSMPFMFDPTGEGELVAPSDLDAHQPSIQLWSTAITAIPSDSAALAYSASFGILSDDLLNAIDTTGSLSQPFSFPSPSHLPTVECQSDNLAEMPPLPLDLMDDGWNRISSPFPTILPPAAMDSPSQVWFDEIISQDVDPSPIHPLKPSPAAISIKENDQVRLVEKQAKLKELRRHQEEVRRLEAELAL